MAPDSAIPHISRMHTDLSTSERIQNVLLYPRKDIHRVRPPN